jgi:hypothetical protein
LLVNASDLLRFEYTSINCIILTRLTPQDLSDHLNIE